MVPALAGLFAPYSGRGSGNPLAGPAFFPLRRIEPFQRGARWKIDSGRLASKN